MSGAWGVDAWGTDSFGIPSGGNIQIASAFASSTNTIRVVLTVEPRHSSGFSEGDALNPATWTVQRLDDLTFFTVLAIREVDPPLSFDVLVLEPLASYRITHRIKSTTLLSAAGSSITLPNSADFLGVVSADLASVSARVHTQSKKRDLANPQAPTGLNSIGGTLHLGSDGDYLLESGTALVKKLIIRRLTTRPGDFFHLPDYGIGIAVKEPVPSSGNLLKLKGDIERQVLREPEVTAAQATVSLSVQGVLTIQLKAKLRTTGEEIDVNIKHGDNFLQL